jgi:hypothetical protein
VGSVVSVIVARRSTPNHWRERDALKSVTRVEAVNVAQGLTYMRVLDLRLGLLSNAAPCC